MKVAHAPLFAELYRLLSAPYFLSDAQEMLL